MKKLDCFAITAALTLLPVAAGAQTGCVHSPECPTALLGVVGAGGAALYSRWRSRRDAGSRPDGAVEQEAGSSAAPSRSGAAIH